MNYVIEHLGENAKYNDLSPFFQIYDYLLETGTKPRCNGKDILIVNDGGIRNTNIPQHIKALLKDYDWQQNVFRLLPLLPKTAAGKFSGKVELHTNARYLEKIKFIPR